ncbi:MAG TPA: aminotransferase class I/II-fold pyridoxal phosphate-dependent enzyme [Lutibacter sp.]|nr:aminotransferase class I/II-fold pyridoxal phosphate-dependent enzyme [Lutibacter sp.]
MNKERIWLSSPHMGGNEQKYVQEAFDTNWVAPLGPNVNGFEQDLENYLNTKVHVAALSAGTGAIHLALIQLGVQQNDTVLCQSFTFAATANPITYLGAKPIFIDSEEETWNIDPVLLEKAIKYEIKLGEKPKAILVVHLYGMPAKMDEIKVISTKYSIPIIEDAAEALGSTYKNQKCGILGDFGILSFNGNKIITTSGGGALVCNTKEAKDKTIYLSTQARDQAPHYQHTEIGFNYRMSNIVAGIGRGQMEVIDLRVKQRRANFEFYKNAFRTLDNLKILEEPTEFYSNRWLTTILTDSFQTREKLRLALDKENIEARPLWKPMHLQPVFSECKAYTNGVSEELFDKGLCLPSGSNLTQSDLKRVVNVIKSCI